MSLDNEYMKEYINEKIQDLSKKEKIIIGKLIYNNITNKKQIKEKGTGLEINMRNFNYNLIKMIYEKVKEFEELDEIN